MATEIKAEYPCSQKDLYSVLTTAWGNYGVHLDGFSAFKAFYTEEFKNNALAAIAAAKALPDKDARSGASEMLHIGLENMGKTCLRNFQFLKSYIETAYPDTAEQKVQQMVAGQNYYRAAGQQDWESIEAMNQSAKNYLTNSTNFTKLKEGNNMPDGFVDTQKNASDAFDLQYNSFKMAEETSEATAAKISANNAIYHSGISMLKDGQTIFADEPAIATNYVFSNLLALINPPVAGIKGTVKQAVTFEPIPNATISAQSEGEMAQAIPVDLNGDFAVQLAAGKYTIKVGAMGFVEQVYELDLKLTGLKTLIVVLVKDV